MRHLERQVLLALKEFANKEFASKGPESVEVLRIKSSTLIKHFKKLRGVTYIIAETYKDYVRIYFFLPQGILLGADNFEHEKYQKARKEARLIYRLAKPEEPTEADLYLQATEQVFKRFTKTLKKVQRTLNLKILNDPVVFISKTPLNEENSLFGTTRFEDRVVFEEKYIDMPIIEGMMIREAFRNLCPKPIVNSELIIELANFVALKMLSKEEKESWKSKWIKNSASYDLTTHLLRHEYTYDFPNISELVNHIKGISPNVVEKRGYEILEAYHSLHYIRNENIAYVIDEALKDLTLFSEHRHKELVEAIHLEPRIIPNYKAYGLSVSLDKNDTTKDYLIKIETQNNQYFISLKQETTSEITEYTHTLMFQQVMPKRDGWGLTNKIRGILLRNILGLSVNSNSISKSISFDKINMITTEDELELFHTINKKGTIDQSQLEIIEEAITSNKIQVFLSFHHVIPPPNILLNVSKHDNFKFVKEHICSIIPESHVFKTHIGGIILLHIPIEWWSNIITQIPKDVYIEPIVHFESKGILYHNPDKNPEQVKIIEE